MPPGSIPGTDASDKTDAPPNVTPDASIPDAPPLPPKCSVTPKPTANPNAGLPAGPDGGGQVAQSLTLGDTTVFGNTMVNALRFAWNRTAVNRDNDPFFDPPSLGIKASTYVPGAMIVVVTGGFQISAATATRGIADNNSFQINDDLTLVRGNHQIGLGGSLARFRVSFRTWARGGGQWNFTGQASGLGLADLLLGRVATVDQSGLSGVDYYQWYQALYAQDTWRASSRVTVNAGLRFENEFLPPFKKEVNGIKVANPVAFGWVDKIAPRLALRHLRRHHVELPLRPARLVDRRPLPQLRPQRAVSHAHRRRHSGSPQLLHQPDGASTRL